MPDIVGKLDRAKADVLYELLKDAAATAERLMVLRELLPRCNVSALVAGHPRLMLGMTVSIRRRQYGWDEPAARHTSKEKPVRVYSTVQQCQQHLLWKN